MCVCVWYIYIYTHRIFFIHFSVSGQVGCFHVLAVVNSAAVNIGLHVSFRTMFFSRYMPRKYLYIVCYISFISIKFVHTHTHTHTHTPLFSGKLVAKHLPVYHHHPHLFGPQWKWRTFATVLLMKFFHSFLFSKWNSLWFIDLSLLVLYSVFEVCTPGHMIVFQRGDDPCWVGWETDGGAWKERELAVRRLGSLPCRRMSSWVIPSIISF